MNEVVNPTVQDIIASLRERTWLSPVSADDMNRRDRWLADVLEAALAALRAAPPTDQPADARGRFMLNAYGRQCYDLGYESGKAASPAVDVERLAEELIAIHGACVGGAHPGERCVQLFANAITTALAALPAAAETAQRLDLGAVERFSAIVERERSAEDGVPQIRLSYELALALQREISARRATPDLERITAFCEQTARDGILPSLAWFSETAATLRSETPKGMERYESLLEGWRDQDRILQEIAGIVGDEHVACAGDVLTAVREFAEVRGMSASATKKYVDSVMVMLRARAENGQIQIADAGVEWFIRDALVRLTAIAKQEEQPRSLP